MNRAIDDTVYQVLAQLFPPQQRRVVNDGVFYRIIDDLPPLEEDESAIVSLTLNGNVMTVITRTAYLRREIQVEGGGWDLRDFIETGYRLECDHLDFIHHLIRTPSRGGITPELIAVVSGLLYNIQYDDEAQPIMMMNAAADSPTPNREIAPRLITAETVPADHVCTFCLLTSDETPEDEWVTADGCARHFYHRECILPWRGGNCMFCQASLIPADSE
jgi:hypothetical protein